MNGRTNKWRKSSFMDSRRFVGRWLGFGLALWIGFGVQGLYAQAGGLESPFALGVGARAIGLGNAYVAFPTDATAIYWNPGGLDQLERKNLVLFYTQLLGGTSYSFIGYAHPTTHSGTLGFGVMQLSTGDIRNTDKMGFTLGRGSASRSQFLLSYSKQLPLPISVGATLKVERLQIMNANAAGVGLDMGLLYRPEFESRLLENLTLGFNIQNLVAPRLKMLSFQEVQPWRFRFGLTKPIGLNQAGADGINLLFGFMMARDISTKFNFGSEYIFQNRAFLRFGYNGDAISFGGGLVYRNYHFDYAFGRYSNDTADTGLQHRLSMTIEFGKTKTQLIELARQMELQRIEEETAQRVKLQRRLEFEDLISRGKSYYDQGQYFFALMKFSAARDLFPANSEAEQWVQKAQEQLAAQQEKERQLLAQKEREQAQQAALQAYIDSQYQKGMRFLEANRYQDAIAEWQRGLERDPQNEMLKSLIEKTREQIRKRNKELMAKARKAEKSNRITVALEIYDQILSEGSENDEERKLITEKINQLRKLLTFNDLFRKGLTEYISKNYRKAMVSFREALKLNPKNKKVRQYLDDAEARANARVEDFANETIRRKFLQAVKLIQQEEYQKALQILEELQKQQRYNKRILDAIDLARERFQRK